jgi:L-fucose mutarotase/ribose pyranase (RbsD/FucU family)
MALEPQDQGKGAPELWGQYQSLLDAVPDAAELGTKKDIFQLRRHAFYEEAKKAFAVVHTG